VFSLNWLHVRRINAMKTLSQYVFDDLTIFDNDGEMFGRIGEQAQILEWIAVDEKNICPRILGSLRVVLAGTDRVRRQDGRVLHFPT